MDQPFSAEQMQQLGTLIDTKVGALLQEERTYTRQMVREEVKQQVDQALQPVNDKLDQLLQTETEDITALASDHAALEKRVDDHDNRLDQLEIKPA